MAKSARVRRSNHFSAGQAQSSIRRIEVLVPAALPVRAQPIAFLELQALRRRKIDPAHLLDHPADLRIVEDLKLKGSLPGLLQELLSGHEELEEEDAAGPQQLPASA